MLSQTLSLVESDSISFAAQDDPFVRAEGVVLCQIGSTPSRTRSGR